MAARSARLTCKCSERFVPVVLLLMRSIDLSSATQRGLRSAMRRDLMVCDGPINCLVSKFFELMS